MFLLFFFFNDTATTEIYTLSLHDALPILVIEVEVECRAHLRTYGEQILHSPMILRQEGGIRRGSRDTEGRDRKSTRLNSSHGYISYAVFCLKKKKQKNH